MYHDNVFNLASDISFFKEYSTEGELSAERIFEIVDKFKKEEFGDKESRETYGTSVGGHAKRVASRQAATPYRMLR